MMENREQQNVNGFVMKSEVSVCATLDAPKIKNEQDVQDHVLVANPKEQDAKQYTCKICGKESKTMQNYKNHERTHSGEKPFSCKLCGKSFSTSSTMTKHVKVHTEEKPFQCRKCGKYFKTTGNLKSHMITHSEEMLYECKTCKKPLKRLADLKTHTKVHTGEKPFQCKTCGKQFGHSSSLKIHTRVHTGEKPFKCDICGNGFQQRGQMKNHEKRHVIDIKKISSEEEVDCLNRMKQIGKKNIFVKLVERNITKGKLLKIMKEFILEKGHLNAKHVTKHFHDHQF